MGSKMGRNRGWKEPAAAWGHATSSSISTIWASSRRSVVRLAWPTGSTSRSQATIFGDFDMEQFWEPSEYAEKEYVGAPFTDEQVAALERELAYTLPASYVEFMRYQNGGSGANESAGRAIGGCVSGNGGALI